MEISFDEYNEAHDARFGQNKVERHEEKKKFKIFKELEKFKDRPKEPDTSMIEQKNTTTTTITTTDGGGKDWKNKRTNNNAATDLM